MVSDDVVLSATLVVEEVLDEVVEGGVVDGASDEEVVDVVCVVLVVLGGSEDEDVDEMVDVVLGVEEVDSEEELLEVEDWLVRSLRMLEASAL